MRQSNLAVQRRDLELPAGTVSVTEVWAQRGESHSFELFRKIVDLFAVKENGLVSLREPVDWIELRERFPQKPEAELLLISRHASMPHCLAHSLGAEFSCVRLSDLYRDEPEQLVTVDAHGVEVPRDQRVAMIEKGEELFVRYPDDYPLIVGTDEVIRMLVSVAPGEHPPKICRARDTRVNYAAFQHLWEGASATECLSVEGLIAMHDKWARLCLACGIGKTMGRTHASNMLNGDAHAPNFVVRMLDDAVPVDHEDGLTLIPKSTAAQCAADISSLLPDMDRPEWLAFRAGYLYRWPDGREVIELMEGAPSGTAIVREDELALNFARALSLTGGDADALALYERIVAERTERLGHNHPDTRDAAAALLAGTVLAHAPADSAVQPPTD